MDRNRESDRLRLLPQSIEFIHAGVNAVGNCRDGAPHRRLGLPVQRLAVLVKRFSPVALEDLEQSVLAPPYAGDLGRKSPTT